MRSKINERMENALSFSLILNEMSYSGDRPLLARLRTGPVGHCRPPLIRILSAIAFVLNTLALCLSCRLNCAIVIRAHTESESVDSPLEPLHAPPIPTTVPQFPLKCKICQRQHRHTCALREAPAVTSHD